MPGHTVLPPRQEVEIMEIKNGIHLLDGIRGANSYLSVTEDGILVIDTGMPGNAERIHMQIKALNKATKEIKLIVLTHSDIDHSGSAAELKRITGAKVAIHGGDAPSLSGEKELKRVKGFIGAIFRLMTRFMRFQTIKPDIILKDGDEIDYFRVIHTPGHTEGSICLYKTGDVLFAGDVIRTDDRGSLKLSPSAMMLNAQEALKSVRKIAGLEFDILLPGHGRPAMGKASTKLKELLVQMKWDNRFQM
jgi:glyoxylase-like metal-dependent hydrolase (beta-lactamase superfamily II)